MQIPYMLHHKIVRISQNSFIFAREMARDKDAFLWGILPSCTDSKEILN
jgi:hypothetical protein